MLEYSRCLDGLELLVQGLKEVLFERMLLTLRNAMATHVFNRANTRLSNPFSLSMLNRLQSP